jgi:two-component system C4-dicarboxylate transport sensor histidine kinase DctB
VASSLKSDAAGAGRGRAGPGDLGELHRRFARSVVLIYLGAAAVAIALLIVSAATDMAHEQTTARDALLLDTETRSHYFGRELGLLASELRRLGLRSEVDLLDQNMAPEEGLLRLSHEKSAVFNVGVGIIDRNGVVALSLPSTFLPQGRSVAGEGWFASAQRASDVQIVPVSPESPKDALVYLVAPVVRNGKFSGALIGAIDLTGELGADPDTARHVLPVVTTRDGAVVYPAAPPAFALTPAWRRLFVEPSWEPSVHMVAIDGNKVVAGDPVPGSELVMLSVIAADYLDAPARSRLVTRLATGIGVAVVPLFLLVLLLRRTLASFGAAQEQAARDERLKLVGEAANLIAHEIKNSLNGLQVGLELVTRGNDGTRTVLALKKELTRLSSFTTRLLTFSKGVVPRTKPLDLGAFTAKVCDIYAEQAAEAQVALEVDAPAETARVTADPALVHVVLSNLLVNALDAVGGVAEPRVAVRVGASAGVAELRVVDNGPGVSANVRARLFEPFVTGKPSGVGIGLALARRIARAHGGELTLEPTPSGASFLVTFPASEVSA